MTATIILLTCAVALADEPPLGASGTGNNQENMLERRVEELEGRLDLNQRLDKVERTLTTLDAEKAVADEERLAELRRRAAEADGGGTWSAVLEALSKPLGILLSSAVLTFILGLLKHCHDKQKWQHNRKLAAEEHVNKWRTTYLAAAMDSEKPLDHRLAWLRFLSEASDDPGMKAWASSELQRAENIVKVELSALQGKIVAHEAQLSPPDGIDNALRKRLDRKLDELRKQADEKRNALLLVGPVDQPAG
ncbi:MAG: hypothetical protein JXB39_16695 [Deltaproteobacteria bacterium]|nr:hypothetical protein [Deltaproteobacteria bacterium]